MSKKGNLSGTNHKLQTYLLHLFIYFLKLINFWLHWVFSAARGLSLVVVLRLLIAMISLVVAHRL